MESSRASAGPCCSLAQQIPSLGCCHLLLPLGAPGAHPPPAALAALLPVHPGPGRVMAPRRGFPALTNWRGQDEGREGQERVLGCRDPPASAQACGLAERGGRCRTKAPSQQHQDTPSLPSQPASGTGQQGDTDGEASTEIQPPCAGTRSQEHHWDTNSALHLPAIPSLAEAISPFGCGCRKTKANLTQTTPTRQRQAQALPEHIRLGESTSKTLGKNKNQVKNPKITS